MKRDENQTVEYKRSWRDEYLRWVCGFANAKGAYSPEVSFNPKKRAPKFYSAVGCFVVTLPNLRGEALVQGKAVELGTEGESSQESSQEINLSELSPGARKVYRMIIADERITAAKIAKNAGVSSRMAFKYISELRRLGLRHEGATKAGRWVFAGKGDAK